MQVRAPVQDAVQAYGADQIVSCVILSFVAASACQFVNCFPTSVGYK